MLRDEPLTLRDSVYIRLAKFANFKTEISLESVREQMANARANNNYHTIPLWDFARPRGRPFPPEGEPTLAEALQDLADILALEAQDAFTVEYFPRIADIDVTDDHVKALMTAMQREVDGEANCRNRTPVRFSELPWERQCGLAERRRYWFGQFGIGRQEWEANQWSLWNVSDVILVPEEVKMFRFGS